MQRTLPTPGTPLTKRRILCATELRYLTERLSRPEVELAPDEAARVADAFRRYLQRVGSWIAEERAAAVYVELARLGGTDI
jgi:hypothetical protein